MKFLVLIILVSSSAFALPKMDELMVKAKDLSKDAMEACKEDKSKIKGCESYTEMDKIKTCLLQNKEKLSDKCKIALKLAK